MLTLIVVLVGTAAAYALWIGQMSYETPKYDVVERIGDVELRAYAPTLVAETVVEGTAENAGNLAFRILANYITGANRPAEKIEMTTPVNQEPQRIAMTAPVTQDARDGRFAIQFSMPSKYTIDTLPEPTDARIIIREVPGRELAAVRYSGTWSIKRYERNLRKLEQTLEEHGYEPVGEPIWARYDPPFKPWFLRRNEVMLAYRAGND